MASKIEIIIQALDKASGPLGKVNQSLGKTGSAASGAGSQFTKMAGAWAKTAFSAAAIGGAVLALADYLKKAGAEAGRFAEINAKQEAILTATGHAAGLTSRQLDGMARELTKLTEIELSTVKETQSLMLTFRNISGDTFPRAMKAAADLSTTFGGINSAAMQLGKALNDPLTGITALNRAGVTFSEQQKETIKRMVEMGDVAGAQAIILAEVEAQVGGTAEAMAAAGDGSARLKSSLQILSAEVGRSTLPIQQRLNKVFADAVDAIADNIKASQDLYDIRQQVLEQVRETRRETGFTTQDIQHQVAIIERQNSYLSLSRDELAKLGVQYYETGDAVGGFTEVTEETTQAIVKQSQEFLKLAESLSTDLQKAADQQAEFAKKRADIEAEITKKIKQGYSEQGSAIQGLRGELEELIAAEQKSAQETELASNRRKFAMLSELVFAAEDFSEGHQRALEEVGIAWGVLTEEGVAEAQAMRAEVKKVADDILGLKDKTITLTINTIGSLPGMTSLSAQYAGQYIDAQHRATGGSVMAGSPYIVGEVGPELFVPSQSGQIVPNSAMGNGNTTVVINYASTFSTASPQELEAFVPVVERAIRQLKGSI